MREEAIAEGSLGLAASAAIVRLAKARITSPIANANLVEINTCLPSLALAFPAARPFTSFESRKSSPSNPRSFYIRFAKITVRKPMQTTPQPGGRV
jgi:hypothetical protein